MLCLGVDEDTTADPAEIDATCMGVTGFPHGIAHFLTDADAVSLRSRTSTRQSCATRFSHAPSGVDNRAVSTTDASITRGPEAHADDEQSAPRAPGPAARRPHSAARVPRFHLFSQPGYAGPAQTDSVEKSRGGRAALAVHGVGVCRIQTAPAVRKGMTHGHWHREVVRLRQGVRLYHA